MNTNHIKAKRFSQTREREREKKRAQTLGKRTESALPAVQLFAQRIVELSDGWRGRGLAVWRSSGAQIVRLFCCHCSCICVYVCVSACCRYTADFCNYAFVLLCCYFSFVYFLLYIFSS